MQKLPQIYFSFAGLFAAFAVDDVNHSKTSSLTEPSLTLEALVVTATAVNLSRGLLCAAFENGEIRLYNYPHIESTVKCFVFIFIPKRNHFFSI